MDEVEFYLEDLKSRFMGINGDEYYLSYSGGKDSHFLYWFIKDYLKDNKIQIVAINTRMEHPEIMRRMYKYADKVLVPEHTIKWAIDKYGMPCFSKQKDEYIMRYQNGCRTPSLMSHILGYNFKTGKPENAFRLPKDIADKLLHDELHRISNRCCDVTKKRTAHKYERESGRKAILGTRQAEGLQRRVQITGCFTADRKFRPLYDMTDEMMDEIYQRYNIEIPDIYMYITRTGCMGCPYGHWNGDTSTELSLLSEAQRNYVISLFKESYDELGVNYEYIQERLL